MRRPSRRFILKAVILLIAGAVVNVAVAWGIVSADADRTQRYIWDADFLPSSWPSSVPEYWPAPSSFWWEESAFGVFHWGGRESILEEGTEHIIEEFKAQCINAGWPMGALHSLWYEHSTTDRVVEQSPGWMWHVYAPKPFEVVERIPYPIVPTWPGFAVNTLFYAGVLWALFCGPFALRRMIRRRRGQCAQCAYPIGTSEVCTECGTPHRRGLPPRG